MSQLQTNPMTEPAVRPARILPLIILSQFACTTIWFAGNAVMADLQQDWHLSEGSLGYVIFAVQVGFIVGTLVFAVLAIADRFSPRKVFFACALAGGGASMGVALIPESFEGLLILRFLTGFFLAGIYAVGMKIATGWFAEGLGRALGYFVGALVLGTALPHLLRALGADLPWEYVIVCVSVLAIAGGTIM
jgi:MFS transporter, DHA1 family, inner membrane transport protein